MANWRRKRQRHCDLPSDGGNGVVNGRRGLSKSIRPDSVDPNMTDSFVEARPIKSNTVAHGPRTSCSTFVEFIDSNTSISDEPSAHCLKDKSSTNCPVNHGAMSP
jgi:hypothetical protein